MSGELAWAAFAHAPLVVEMRRILRRMREATATPDDLERLAELRGILDL